jgi:cell division septation protein DedD
VALPDPEEFTPGWRVQIFASSAMASAEELAKEARRKFTEAVYVEYEPPLYKVRVGDFLTKPAAKQMATRVQAEGYDAWVVETLVVRPR